MQYFSIRCLNQTLSELLHSLLQHAWTGMHVILASQMLPLS